MPTIEVNGAELYYQEAGEGPPIVFAHPVMATCEFWEPQVNAFSEEYRTVVYDLRGHGETGPTDRASYSLGLLADDLHSLVEGLGLENPTVCGLSLGGMVAATYAARYPEEPHRILIAGVAESSFFEQLPQTVLVTLQNTVIRLIGKERMADAITAILPKVTDMSPSEARERNRAFRQVSEAEHWKMGDLLDDALDDIPFEEIQVPTLFVRGAAEAGDCSGLQMNVPHARRISIADAGHLVSYDAPDEFNDVLERFLSR